MDAGRWERVEALFIDALDLDPTGRQSLLERECRDDPGLRAEVESLLEAHDGMGPVGEMAEESRLEGRFPERMGPYRIVRILGEGGMGVVLLAVREADGFEQTVALKLVRGRLLDPLLARRFEEERRILARLEHPGIARLIDGGVTEDGYPFFAMEYVDGKDLLSWCDERRLDLDERLRLFVRVCDAVHAAHRQMVVHRDLKPSNILVTPDGQPKLLDFGIAKSLEGEAAGRTELWVTPAYASPEQVTGQPVTVVTDVYALGVLLCELLTGFRPYRTERLPTPRLSRVISETPPRRPSELAERGLPPLDGEGPAAAAVADEVAAAARNRRQAPAQLARALRGDLDIIVLAALAKEPERRYDSARRLADDLRRYLDGRPVEARPATLAYRVGKLVRRNAAASVAAALFVTAVAAGTLTTVWQARRAGAARDAAQEEAARARQVTALMTDLFRLGDPTLNVGDTIGVRQVLEEGATRVAETLAGDPELQATLYLELARVYRNLGILDRAQDLAHRTLALREAEGTGTLAYAEALGFRALLARDLGEGLQAASLLEDALALRATLVPTPDTVAAALMAALAWEVRSAGDFQRADSLFRQVMAIQERERGPDHPAVTEAFWGLASTLHDLGSFDQAEALFAKAMERGGGGQPDPVVAGAMLNLGMIRRLREHYPEALPLVRDGRDMRAALYDPDHPDRIEADEQWGVTLAALGRYREAEPVLVDALERSVRVLGEEHAQTRSVREALAGVDWILGRFDLALAREDSVRLAKVRAHQGDHPGVVYTLNSMAAILLESSRPDEARARLREAMTMGERLGGTEGVYG
ncbi:MAG TPA: serine/threonine-protein kinase, partial [Longimicrobiales bacterium]|nr:serine/threonine-protein kinase [Longimicrobiales bacterium]